MRSWHRRTRALFARRGLAHLDQGLQNVHHSSHPVLAVAGGVVLGAVVLGLVATAIMAVFGLIWAAVRLAFVALVSFGLYRLIARSPRSGRVIVAMPPEESSGR